MHPRLRQEVRERALARCEYCHFPASCSVRPFQIDHIIASQHGGSDESSNLAFVCYHCNLHKGPNIAGIDPETQEMVRLFHPRADQWREHFRWEKATLVGIGPVGRTTVAVLAANDRLLVAAREELMTEGVYPTGE